MTKLYTTIGTFCLLSFAINAQTTQTFLYTGSMQTFVVPACVNSIDIDMRGARGGGDTAVSAPGGRGGRVQCTLPVTPGQTLYIYVGGQGDPLGAAGYNGGGTGIGGSTSIPGGGGGGASDIRIGGMTLNDRVLVAGGGGGGTDNGGASSGGTGGGLIGGTGGIGGNPWGCTNLTAAGGGTQSAGGAGGTSVSCAWNGFNGSFGQGGNSYTQYRCAGGGGGWYGGGGAHNGCAGGGGSSYTSASATAVAHTQGYQYGNGGIIITYSATSAVAPGALTGSDSLCVGTTENYSIAPLAGATSYTWSVPAGSVINSGQGTTSINVTAGITSGNISVYATYPCGNSATTNYSLNISTYPVVNASATDTVLCSGGMVTLTGSGAVAYSWSNGVSDGVPFTPSATNTYTVIGANAFGCADTAMVTVAVNALPTVNLGSDVTQCGGSVTLDAGNPGSAYSWNTGDTTQVISATNSGTYYVGLNDLNGCVGTDTIMVTINAIPTVNFMALMPVVCADDDSISLSGTPTGGTFSGTGVFGSMFSPNTAGAGTFILTYTYTDSLGCTGTDTASIVVDLCLGEINISLADDVDVFPNPNSGVLTIVSNADLGESVIEVTDMQGRVVYSTVESNVNTGFTKQIILSDLADGIYMLKISASNEQHVEPIIIQR